MSASVLMMIKKNRCKIFAQYRVNVTPVTRHEVIIGEAKIADFIGKGLQLGIEFKTDSLPDGFSVIVGLAPYEMNDPQQSALMCRWMSSPGEHV